jgi:hypothetical protein
MADKRRARFQAANGDTRPEGRGGVTKMWFGEKAGSFCGMRRWLSLRP